jgi:glyoxylase-like metal-dependent hydrolase (beta-lactamase superfamily II)
MNTGITQVGQGLHLVRLPVAISGFDGFVTTWVHTAGPVVVVDVGPSATAPFLLGALAGMGVDRPDLILLTHVHIDHAGGIGEVARAFPDTPVVCHPKAVEHLVDPGRLWAGSRKTLGEVARRYGPIAPVAAKQVRAADGLDFPGINAVPTPGHAPHHYSYFVGDLLFAGEAGGVCVTLDDGGFYMRPATPPRFFLETCLDSIDRLLAFRPDRICYSHAGMRQDAAVMLRAHREQLLRWQQIITEGCGAGREDEERALADCLALLLARDPLLSGFAQLPPDARERERFFLRNSIKGYWGYLRTGPD